MSLKVDMKENQNINFKLNIMDKLKNESALRLLKHSFETIDYDYSKLTDEEKSLISEDLFYSIVEDIRNLDSKNVDTRLNKLVLVVDYIKVFVDGALGSEAAKLIEDSIVKKLDESINYDKTKYKRVIVIFLGDEHSTNYLQTREGKHLPIEHAIVGTKGCNLYGKVSSWYRSHRGRKDVFMIKKQTFGVSDVLDCVNSPINIAMDKIGYLMNDEDLNSDKFLNLMEPGKKEKDYDWNLIYDTYQNVGSKSIIPDEVEIMGVATNICVLSNAVCIQTQYPQAEIFIDEGTVASYDKDLHKKALDIMESMGINVKRTDNLTN